MEWGGRGELGGWGDAGEVEHGLAETAARPARRAAGCGSRSRVRRTRRRESPTPGSCPTTSSPPPRRARVGRRSARAAPRAAPGPRGARGRPRAPGVGGRGGRALDLSDPSALPVGAAREVTRGGEPPYDRPHSPSLGTVHADQRRRVAALARVAAPRAVAAVAPQMHHPVGPTGRTFHRRDPPRPAPGDPERHRGAGRVDRRLHRARPPRPTHTGPLPSIPPAPTPHPPPASRTRGKGAEPVPTECPHPLLSDVGPRGGCLEPARIAVEPRRDLPPAVTDALIRTGLAGGRSAPRPRGPPRHPPTRRADDRRDIGPWGTRVDGTLVAKSRRPAEARDPATQPIVPSGERWCSDTPRLRPTPHSPRDRESEGEVEPRWCSRRRGRPVRPRSRSSARRADWRSRRSPTTTPRSTAARCCRR